MATSSHYNRRTNRRFRNAFLILCGIAFIIGVPLAINNQLRYDLAMRFNMAPGQSAEHVSKPEDNATLVVIPLPNVADPNGPVPWLFAAKYIAWPDSEGTRLENIETGQSLRLPMTWFDHIAADDSGEHVLFRGPDATEPSHSVAALVTASDFIVETLQSGTPNLPGNWTDPVWSRYGGYCDWASPNKRFIACFERPGMRTFLAGDWQVNIQAWGKFDTNQPLYRGIGSRPWMGFTRDGTVLYMQNPEQGIVKIKVPDSLLQLAPATPLATPAPTSSRSEERFRLQA